MDDSERDYWTARAVREVIAFPRCDELMVLVGQFGYREAWHRMTLEEMIAVGGWLMQHRKPAEHAR